MDVQFRELDVMRWETLSIDASDAQTPEACLDDLRRQMEELLEDTEDLILALRVVIEGRTDAHDALAARPLGFREDIRAVANDYGEGRTWIEKVELRTKPCNAVGSQHSTDDAMGELLSIIKALTDDETALAELAKEFAPLTAKLPVDFWEGKSNEGTMNTDELLDAVDQAYPMLAARLHESEGEP